MHNKKDMSVELMRVIAAFFVVMAHASGTSNAVEIAFNAIGRFTVPLFIIISGRFMLGRERDFRDIAKRCVRLLVLLLVTSCVYYVFLTILKKRPDQNFLTYIFTKPVHLWYLWCAIGLYLLTPILSVFANGASRSVYRYALGITFLLGSVIATLLRTGAIPLLSEVIEASKLPYQLGFVFCYMIGDYIERFEVKKTRGIGIALFAAGVATSIVGSVLLLNTAHIETALSLFTPSNIAAAVGLYLAFRTLRMPEHLSGAVRILSSATLGVYLLHPMAISLLRPFFEGLSGLPLVKIPLFAIAAFALTTLAVSLPQALLGYIKKNNK